MVHLSASKQYTCHRLPYQWRWSIRQAGTKTGGVPRSVAWSHETYFGDNYWVWLEDYSERTISSLHRCRIILSATHLQQNRWVVCCGGCCHGIWSSLIAGHHNGTEPRVFHWHWNWEKDWPTGSFRWIPWHFRVSWKGLWKKWEGKEILLWSSPAVWWWILEKKVRVNCCLLLRIYTFEYAMIIRVKELFISLESLYSSLGYIGCGHVWIYILNAHLYVHKVWGRSSKSTGLRHLSHGCAAKFS